jgi:glycosyltransferase involved in cell wall biosynthesis
MPKVSIIMPVYNAEKFIKTAIESILNQTFQDFELIMIDDHSTDYTIELIRQVNSEKLIIIQTPQNSGAAISRNLGIKSAKGEYIAFMDADDWSHPQRLEKQITFLDNNPPMGMVGTWADIVDEQGNVLDSFVWEIPQNQLRSRLLFHNCFVTSSVMVRREYALLLFDNAYPPAEDYELWRRIAKQTEVAIIREKLVKYLSHGQGISKRKEELMQENRLKILHLYLSDLGIMPTSEEVLLHQQIAHFAFSPSKDFLKNANDWLLKIRKANEIKQHFSTQGMKETLADYWFKICSAHLHLGVFTFSHLLQSPLSINILLPLRTKLALLCLYNEIKIIFR